MTLLLLSASAIVVIGLFWLLQRLLASSADDGVPMRWWHLGIAISVLAASAVLIVYLTW
jgi:hypothetical protein